MKRYSVHRLAFSAMIAAVYAALTVATGFMSFGTVQLRIAEALCILPYFFPYTALGLFAGCLLANLMSPLGALDVVFGSLATLLSCLCIAVIGKEGRERGWGSCVAACCMPVVWNGILVGGVIALTGEYPLLLFPVMMGAVALGEAAVMFILGLPLLRWLPDGKAFRKISEMLDRGESSD